MEDDVIDPNKNCFEKPKNLSKKAKTNAGFKKLKASIDALPDENNKSIKVPTVNMAARYRNAFNKIYLNQESWRRKEIDKQLESGSLSDRDWDTDFVQQVTSLAESDDPLEV